MSEFLVIDGISYNIPLIDVQRSADVLDAQAHRTEDGVLHRKVIGTYMNYTVKVGIVRDMALYDSLFNVLSSPVEFHQIQLPGESGPQSRYVSSVKDGLKRVLSDGTTKYRDLSFKVTCKAPTRKA